MPRRRSWIIVAFCAASFSSAFATEEETTEAPAADWREDGEKSQDVLRSIERAVCNRDADDTIAAFLLLGICMLLPLTFALSVEAATARTTWSLLEQFMAIFLAASWFSAVNEFIPATIAGAGVHMLIAYFGSLVILWSVRDRARLMNALCAVFAHYVSFTAMKTGSFVQEEYFSSSPLNALICCALVVSVTIVFWYVKCLVGALLQDTSTINAANRKEQEEFLDEWNEASDDLGWDVSAMALALTLMQAISAFVFGPLGSVEEGNGFYHTPTEGCFSLLCALGFTGVDALLSTVFRPMLHPPEGEAESSFCKMNAVHLLHNTLTMSAAWGYLSATKCAVLGLKTVIGASPSSVAVMTALVCSVKSVVMIVALSALLNSKAFAEHKGIRNVAKRLLKATSLVSAWSWEAAFDAVFDKGLIEELYQLGLVFSMSLLLVPIYVLYLLPAATKYKKTEKQD